MPDHSPEPWSYYSKGSLILDANGSVVLDGSLPAPTPRTAASDALPVNMRRIVAAVNACKGIPKDVLDRRAQYVQEVSNPPPNP